MTNFLLGILKNGQIMNPDEVAASEADTPANYATARLAVAAGRALMDRQPTALGFTVAKTFDAGHYRTVHTELRESTNPPMYRVVQDDRHHYAQTGIMRSFILEGPRGATVAVWEYANAAMRVVNTKGQEPPAVQRDAALAAVRAYLKQ